MKYLIAILTVALGLNAYYTYRTFNFGKQQMKYNEYTEAKADCAIAIGTDALYKLVQDQGRAFHKENKWPMYSNHLPACAKFYGQYMCWMLNPKDPVSLDKCGESFGYSKEEIETMKQTKEIIRKKGE